MTTDREARLAALAARRTPPSTPADGQGDPTPPARSSAPRAGRGAALSSRVLVAGLSAASMLGLVAFVGAGSAVSAADAVPPTTVVHRIVVVSSPPPPEPDIVLQAVPAGREVTVVAPPPAPRAQSATTAGPRPKPRPATQTAPAAATTRGSGH